MNKPSRARLGRREPLARTSGNGFGREPNFYRASERPRFTQRNITSELADANLPVDPPTRSREAMTYTTKITRWLPIKRT